MTFNKRKKNSRQRGLTTHGWGSRKKHRGSGNRGGRGKAGTGKRAAQKKPGIMNVYGPEYFGRRGFNIPQKVKKKVKAINIFDLPEQDKINLNEMGYDKLLGEGAVKRRYEITVKSFSKSAKEKIEKFGGKIIEG